MTLLPFTGIIRRRKTRFVAGGGLIVAFLVVLFAVALGGPPLPDRTRPVLASQYGTTEVLRTLPSGEAVSTPYRIGPVTTWRGGLVYWDDRTRNLFHLQPDGKRRRIVPRPAIPNMMVFNLAPAPDAIYLNLCGNEPPRVVRVRLSDGAAQTLNGAEQVSASEHSEAFAFETPHNKIVVVRDGKRRTVPLGVLQSAWSWDYDPDRDAVVTLEEKAIRWVSPTRSWRLTRNRLTDYRSIQFAENGNIWLQRSPHLFGREGTWVIDMNGKDRGWRLNREIPSSFAQRFTELTPEQERLARSLPNPQP